MDSSMSRVMPGPQQQVCPGGRCRQVKHMGLEERVKLARLIVALAEDDRPAVVKAYTDMGVRTKRMGQ